MTDHTDKLIEQRIADMTAEQFDALVARTRPPEIFALKEKAAAMLRGEELPATETPSWNPTTKPAPKSSDKERAAAEIRNHIHR
jgi:hypothetical protein